eukprot:209424-Pelagomonas_calceolata.AAC.5
MPAKMGQGLLAAVCTIDAALTAILPFLPAFCISLCTLLPHAKPCAVCAILGHRLVYCARSETHFDERTAVAFQCNVLQPTARTQRVTAAPAAAAAAAAAAVTIAAAAAAPAAAAAAAAAAAPTSMHRPRHVCPCLPAPRTRQQAVHDVIQLTVVLQEQVVVSTHGARDVLMVSARRPFPATSTSTDTPCTTTTTTTTTTTCWLPLQQTQRLLPACCVPLHDAVELGHLQSNTPPKLCMRGIRFSCAGGRRALRRCAAPTAAPTAAAAAAAAATASQGSAVA